MRPATPSLAEQRQQLAQLLREAERANPAPGPAQPFSAADPQSPAPMPMAIIGLAGRYPGAENIDEFWSNLIGQRNCIQAMAGERARDYALADGARIRHFGLLKDVFRFDAPFFNISRREAEVMDPHMRLLLETVWSCVENTGYRPRSLDRQTGVFTSFYNYEYAAMLQDVEVDAASEPYLATATTGAIFSNRISFLLGLNGPSEVYNTACSTALVALHRGIQAIAAGDCRQAIIAGVSLLLTPGRVMALSGMGILNETGVCNPYSHPANGEVIGEGVGALLIKPLARALADRDYVYAVVLGTDVSHQGSRSGGLTLPSADALAELMAATYRKLGIGPERIRYIEGHGAGGEADVVELRAWQQFLASAGLKRGKVPVGSVKGNIGFGEASGGLAQLTKCALAFHHGQIPATLHFEQADPVFDLDHSLLEIQTENAVLESGKGEAYASILAYGLGGTNGHVVLGGQPLARVKLDESRTLSPILISAGSEANLAEYARQLSEHLRGESTLARYRAICGSDAALLWCVARTLAGRERHAKFRAAFLVDTLEAFQKCCADYLAGVSNEKIVRPGTASGRAEPDPIRAATIRWVGGEDDACGDCWGTGLYQKLPLPGVPFQGEVYRLRPKLKSEIADPSSIEDRWVVTRSNRVVMVELALTSQDCFIADHLVDGLAVMPGTAYLALLSRIARQVYQSESCVIENLAWIKPLEIREGSATLRFEFAESGVFRVSHQERDELYCKGRLVLDVPSGSGVSQAQVIATQLAGLTPLADRPQYWARANAPETRQIHGEPLRRLAAVYQWGETIIGRLDPFAQETPLADIAFLDSALGVCRGFSISDSAGPQAVVPFAVERIQLGRAMPATEPVFVAAKARHDALGRYDISIEDGTGKVYAVLLGYYPKPFAGLAKAPKNSEAPDPRPVLNSNASGAMREFLQLEVRRRVAEFLKCDLAAVPLAQSLAPLGLDSIGINALTDQLGRSLNFDLPATAFFEYASIRDLVEYLMREFPREMAAFAGAHTASQIPSAAPSVPEAVPSSVNRAERLSAKNSDIAVIGMGGLFPGASNVRELWAKLRDGRDLITEMPEPRRQSVYRVYADSIRNLKGVHGGFVADADKFDAAFFGFTEAEVMAMDPQQRLFLEASWTAIEDAGYFPLSLSGQKIGVYAGAIVNDYSAYLRDVGYPVSMFHEGTGSSLAGVANRVSYFLNLTGPSQSVDAACCSSLYAVDRAVADLLSGACEAALAGGVSFVCTAAGYDMYSAMSYLAKDWRCKAFAEGGDGWSKAELFAAVFLKRYEDAIRDQDPIYAVIKATGTNHGGKGCFYTQPNSSKHVELMREVYRKAQVDPRSIVHIEAHGSGTEMGDALEFNSISRALKEFAAEKGVSLPARHCGLGSIKSNFGHAEAGSGIAGFIKTALLLHAGSIPPTLHLQAINKHIRLKDSPLYLAREGKTFAEGNGNFPASPRCAGVHSFNFSGAAAHALLAEHVATTVNGSLGLTRYPVCLSAKTPQALAAYCRALAQYLRNATPAAGLLDSFVYTVNRSKSFFPCRWGFITATAGDLIAQLEACAASEGASDTRDLKTPVSKAAADYPSLRDEHVKLLVARWLQEADFDWPEVLKPFSPERLHLPAYPFEHGRSYFPVAGETGVPAKQTAPEVSARVPDSPEALAPSLKFAAPGTVEERLTAILGELFSLPPSAIDLDLSVAEFGFDSLKFIALSDALNRQFGLQTTPPDLFEFATPRAMVAGIAASQPAPRVEASPLTRQTQPAREGVAIVGLSGQFPGARDLDEFWENLVAGKDAITEIPPDRWDWKSLFGDPRREPGKTNVRWGGFIDDVTVFDPLFFRLSPREAEAMDPQQRLLMMHVWRAMEDAGYRPSHFAGTATGLFVGTGSTGYSARFSGEANAGEGYGATGSIPSIGPNRMSHFLDLRGPSEPVETSCSSSLVAIHRAVASILAGECVAAIAGGVNTIVTPDDHIGFSKAGMLCEDGRCKTFSAAANGYVRGEGIGMLFLKSLAAAEADGDRIYGVIKSSVINHGGRSNSLTAPNPKAQAELIQSAYAKAGIDPRTVGYIEAHGTGTPLGDPIEINGLKQAFKALYAATGAPEVREPHCALASVKTNIGHLELAAGVAGVIKVLLQLRHGTLVKSLHCDRLNPYVQLEGTPFYLLTENRPWPQIAGPDGSPLPRRAGISSFGFGGVNAHIVIEEYVPLMAEQRAQPPREYLVVLSAKNESRLKEAAGNLHRFLVRHPATCLADLAYTLQAGREEMEARIALTARTLDEVQEKLREFLAGREGIAGCARGMATNKTSPTRPGGMVAAREFQTGLIPLAEHWVQGGAVDWTGFYEGLAARRISLPTYPFARERCWREASPLLAPFAAAPSTAQETGETDFIARWQEAAPGVQPATTPDPKTVVIVHSGPAAGLPAALAAHCGARFPGAKIVRLPIGAQTLGVTAQEGQCGRDDAEGFATCLRDYPAIDWVCFISNLETFDPACPAGDALQLLRLAQTLKHRMSAADAVDCFVITTDCYRVNEAGAQPAGAGLAGLAYSLAQGDHRFRARNLDLSAKDMGEEASLQATLDALLAEPPSHRGEVIKFESGRRYRQRLIPFLERGDHAEGFRQNGVYVILGGHGNVGGMVTRELIRQYRARVVWLGRTPEPDPGICAKINEYADLPAQPVYRQVDALDSVALRGAVDKIRSEFGEIHGAIFAASVFSFNNSVGDTAEAEFNRILDIKARGSVNFYQAFQDVPLDFLCYFSSAQAFSFSGAASLSAYAAGITFSDAWARSLWATAAFPVGSINWGFWETSASRGGAVENVGYLEANTGVRALNRFVSLLRARALHQMLCLRTSPAVREQMPIEAGQLLLASKSAPPWPAEMPAIANLNPPAPAEPAGAVEFEEWMYKLLFVQLRELSLLDTDADAVAPGLRQWLGETRRWLAQRPALIDLAATAREVWQAWDLRRPVLLQERQIAAQIELAEECMRKLPQVLRGEASPAEILFPGASLEKVARVYADNPQFAYFSQAVANTVRARLEHIQSANPGYRARILEIGAGTGGTTSVILASLGGLESCVEEYCYTDLSRAFLLHGERNYRHPFLKFKLLDIEQPPAVDDPGLGTYDLVIAANVLHATKDIRRTVRHAKAWLKRQGQLVLDEIAGPSLFAHVTFGLLPGWWLFADAPLRIPGSPGLYPNTWERVLKEEGFSAVAFPVPEGQRLGQQVVVADSDGWIRLENGSGESRPEKVAALPAKVKLSTGVSGGSHDAVKQRMIALLSDFLKIPAAQLEPDSPFSDYGVDSILGINFIDQLGAALGLSLNAAILFDHTTIDKLSAFIAESYRDQLAASGQEAKPAALPVATASAESVPAPRDSSVAPGRAEIAVIGMAGQFPGAKDVETLWRNLLAGKDGVGELPASYSISAANASGEAVKPGCRRGGVLEDRACFDPLFFNISPREAESMTPHQRLILQESWKALEDAGINPRSLAGTAAGLFIGAEPAGYEHESFTGSSDAIIASRLSYFLDLKGPALVVNTGCSSSATAIHLACQSLRQGESKLALAGGVFAVLSRELLARLSGMDMLSPSGCCRAFDAAADGTVFSEGVGVVVLKRLEDALADGDPIYGIIQASGLNQDGASNGITAPNGKAQESLLVDVYRRFGVDPEQIGYLEAHGTGTKLGDPVEANALVRAFRTFTEKTHFCALGSVKDTLGHASAAAGVIGLIKILLMLRHGKIPAMRHFKRLNPLIELDASAFYINETALDWPAGANGGRVAALNSFGHSGTNVHLVVRSPETRRADTSAHGPCVIVLSAKEEARLKESARNLLACLEANSAWDLRSVAYTLQVGRESMKERLAWVVATVEELALKLKAWLAGSLPVAGCWRGTAGSQDRAIQLLQSDEGSREMLARWIAQGKWEKLAELWALGADIDWRLLYPADRPERVRLPVYSFAREHYWAPEPSSRLEPAAAPCPPKTEAPVLCFAETWEPLAAATLPPLVPAKRIQTLLCLLSEPQNRASFRQAVQAIDPQAKVFFLSQAEAGSAASAPAFDNILREAGTLDALFYGWPVEDRRLRADIAPLLGLLQAVARAKTKPGRILLGGAFEDGLERCHLESWIGIERSLGPVLPGVQISVFLAQSSGSTPLTMGILAQHAWRLLTAEQMESELLMAGTCHRLRARPVSLQPLPPLNLDGKTLLITGGCGGVGLNMARSLAAKWRVNLILTGRSALSASRRETLAALGCAVQYYPANVCDAGAMDAALRDARAKLGPIHGVIHAAGIKDARTVFEKSAPDAQAVLDPKVKGTLVLDEVLAGDPLEFVCYFSSTAAFLGDFGACDYALANRFQMAYADYRNALVAQGKRRGQTRVIGWTQWNGVGMGSGDGDAAAVLKSSGQRPLEPDEAWDLWEQIMPQPATQHLVFAGNPAMIRRVLGCVPEAEARVRADVQGAAVSNAQPAPRSLRERLRPDLKEQLSQLFKLPPARLGDTQNFADFGIDSIGLAEWARLISTRYKIEFTPAVFFGHSTLEAVTAHLLETHAESVQAFFHAETRAPENPPISTDLAPAASPLEKRPANGPEPIAIIGMSGRFPGARNVAEMWQILVEGKSAVGEMPAERQGETRLAQVPRCGCIPGVKEFDPIFFEISPAEAEEMDPRQRLLLQEGWNALEDAGFGPADLERQRIGLFAGVEEGDYPRRAADGSITANHTGILASRLAYFLNLRGPVMALNTSCSSSLVALHQACQSLRNGECEAAVVAGVNLILDPASLLALSQAGMLSPDGACFAFDRRASGMVPGEAVAVVVIKPYSRALADGDPIHAVILGSGINYDGKTNGITAPNGVAQAELIRRVREQSGVQPGDVEYIVAHGTGTRLGDPVEVNALADAFREGSPARKHCALTSCKTNFGHTFAASGLVSVIALVQALRAQTIPASLHFQDRNEYIQWENNPFYVNTSNQPWPAQPGRARIGAVSAFGMSGTNAHVILRDHLEPSRAPETSSLPYVLAWSAKTAEALRERIQQFTRLIANGGVTEAQLPAISRTLLLGRHPFKHRLAIVVRSLAEAALALNPNGQPQGAEVFEGVVETPLNALGAAREPLGNTPANPFNAATEVAGQLRAAAAQWCRGGAVDWVALLNTQSPRRVHLPGYPFARREFWLPSPTDIGNSAEVSAVEVESRPSTGIGNSWLDASMLQRLRASQDGEMDRHLAGLLAATLGSLGLAEGGQNLKQIVSGQSAPAYLERWVEASRRLLREVGLMGTASRPLAEAWTEWDRAKGRWIDNACLRAQANLVERCLRALPEVLRGERRPVEVLFPDSSMELVEAVYRGNPVADAFNQVLGQAVLDWVKRRLAQDPNARIRVLEVGAGTGATTAVVLSQLAPFQEHIAEYCFTDLSRAFLLRAEEQLKPANPALATRIFDVSRPVAGQQIAAGSYDLVIAANVLHATPDIRRAVTHAASTLRHDGALILNELSANGWFTHLTFGLLEGWWLYQDEAIRMPGCPAVSSATWKRLLLELGFGRVGFPAENGHDLGQQIIVAELWRGPQALPAAVIASTPARAVRAENGTQTRPVPADPVLRQQAIAYFKKLIGAALKLEAEEIDAAAPFESYGMDSLMIGKALAKLRESFTEIPSTLLFELQTVGDLADYFLAHRGPEILARLGVKSTGIESAPPVARPVLGEPAVSELPPPTTAFKPENQREPIAIIGLSGRFPGAPNVRAFWENLKAGKDSITEIPADRWSLDGFYHADMEAAIDQGKSYCKWGGFLEGFADFDPLFFNISPRQAMETDPQERLFLQTAWEALEDAGYTREALAQKYDSSVGVFAGIAHSEFNVLGPDQWRQGKWVYPHTSFGSVANRVSFLLNLRGPSMPVDTMCSSALTAIHEACESILRGECLVALAGAVNLCLHPSTYVSLCASRLLSKVGKCHSFGLGDDGYVPAEGAGVVILKRLSEAVRDGDRIHAIIRGTAVNHGGRTNGFTIPNPNAQAKVIRLALDKAGVDARTVSYVETHGAGTKLGDPIEVLGLTRAFRQDTADNGFCALGSVKSNVGHLEAAAGLAGLTKVILQMQHRQLVPSLNSATLNPEIRFAETPFTVQQKLAPWERPAIFANGTAVIHPRRAGVSAFGAGGSNAHIILEEYEDKRPPGANPGGPCLIVLSTRHPSRLKAAAMRLRQFLAENADATLPDVAYTLQTGREAMEERAGFVAETTSDLTAQLTAFIDGKPGGYFQGQVKAGKTERFLDDADLGELETKWIANGDYAKLLAVWVRGYAIDWHRLYTVAPLPRRIGLPTYPFAQDRYWLADAPQSGPGNENPAVSAIPDEMADSWLFFREEWEPQPLSAAAELKSRLAKFAGKHVAIAAGDAKEADALMSLLRQLEAVSGLEQPLRLSKLELEAETKVAEPPEVVLFLGPRATASPSMEPSEKDLSDVFTLSRQLMNACWGDAIEIYYLYESSSHAPRLDCEALSGFVRAAMKENEQHRWTVIGNYDREDRRDGLERLLREWLLGAPGSVEIRYQAGQRFVRKLAEIGAPSPRGAIFRKNGVYVLAGGMGYLGRELSLELARRCQATLVLLTRGGLDEARQAHCRALEALGSKVICASVDIADHARLAAVWPDITRQTGPIHGVFHLARHHEDQIIARKPWASFARVMRPKVQGLLHLDELTKDEPLAFFAVFSSLGAYGARGASDYSYATAFQNAFSEQRNRWVREGGRVGPTVSMCWGPWLEDHLFPESRGRLAQAGFGLIGMDKGFQIMENALAGGISPLALVKVRDGKQIRDLLGLSAPPAPAAELDNGNGLDGLLADWERRRAQGEDVAPAVAGRITPEELNRLPDAVVRRVYPLLFGANGNGKPAVNPSPAVEVKPEAGEPREEAAKIIRAALAELLHLTEIDDERSFMEYGLDSIAGMQLAVRLERRLKREVQPQALVGFPTVAALSDYLMSEASNRT